MAAGDEWDAIQADPEFQAQPAPVKTRVALNFFQQRVAPNVPADQVDSVRHDFFTDAFKPAPQPAAPSTLSMAGSAAMDTLKSPVPYLAPVADALRTGIPGGIADVAGHISAPIETAGYPNVAAGIRGAGALAGTAVGTVGELVPKTGAELAVAGLGGPALEGAGNVAADAAPTVVSKLTGQSVPAAERAISRASELMNPTLLKPGTIDDATQALGDAIKGARSAVGRRLGLAEDTAAAAHPGRILPTASIADELAENFQKAGFSADGKMAPGRDTSDPLNPEIQNIIDKLRNVAPERLLGPNGQPLPRIPRDLPLADAIDIKRKIYGLVSYDKSKLLGLGDTESSLLKDAANNLDDHIRSVSPELNTATDNFSRMAKGYDKLAKSAMSGNVDTVQKRLGRIFAAGDAERKLADPLATVGAGQAALDTLLDAKTAQGFSPVISPRLERAAMNTGGGVLGAAGVGGLVTAGALKGGAPVAAGVAGTLAATSPALNMAAIRAATVPIGENAAVDALASPTSRALVTSPLLRRLNSTQGKK